MTPTLLALLFAWNSLVILLWCPAFIVSPADLMEAFRQYFIRPKFSLPALLENWSLFGIAAADLAGILGVTWVVGGIVARFPAPSLARQGLARFGFGLGTVATGMLGIGLAGLLFPPPSWIIHPLLALAGAGFIWRERASLRGLPAIFPGLPPLTSFTKAVLAASGLITIVGLLNMEMSWDALTYHLRLPTFYIYNHKLFDVWHHYCSPFPFLIEMDYTMALLVQGECLARCINAVFSVLFLCSTASLARETGVQGRWSVLLVAASPLFLVLFDRAYIDPGLAFFVTLSLTLFARWWRTNSSSALAASGLFAGFGLASKYTAVFLVAAVAAAGAGRLKTRAGRRAALLWAAAAFLPFLPWMARDFILRANPVWPYLGFLFGIQADVSPEVTPFFDKPNPLGLWLSTLPRAAAALILDNGRVDGPLLPAIAGFLPLVAWKPASPILAMLRRAALAYLAVWFILAPDVRFLLPMLPAICVLIESSVGPVMAAGGASRTMARIFLEAGLVLGAFIGAAIQWIFFSPFSLALGLDSFRTSMQIALPPPPWTYYAREYVNSHTPKDARIMFLNNFSTYYFERQCIADFFFGKAQMTRILNERRTAPEIKKRMRQIGFRWILSTDQGVAQYFGIPGYFDVPAGVWREWKILLSEHAEAVWQTDNYILYRLGKKHAPRPLPAMPIFQAIEFREADQALDQNRPKDVIRLVNKASPLLADVGATWMRSGDARNMIGDFSGAIQDFRRAEELGVDCPRLHLGLAHALWRLGRLGEAIPHAEKTWEMNPLSPYAAATAASIHASAGNITRARQLINEALKLNPGNTDYQNMARQLDSGGNWVAE